MTTANPQVNVQPGAHAEPQKCSVCEEEIGNRPCFCKIPREEAPTVLLCCPQCALRYFDTLHPTTNRDELDRAERSLHFIVDGEKLFAEDTRNLNQGKAPQND